MLIRNLKWLWEVSMPICQHETGGLKHKANKISTLKRRLVFAVKAAPLINSLLGFMHPRADSPLQHAMQQRPEIVGAAMWPYICSSWSAEMALHQIEDHFKAIETMGCMFDFPVNRALLLLELGDLSPELQIVLDQPKWFMREGLLVINLFMSGIRIYSLAFSFAFESGRIVTYIGAVQGVGTEGILDDYKNLTKELQGMRPRDFLMEVFRIFCRCAGITRIFAVNDSR